MATAVSSRQREAQVFVALDTCSTETYITEELASRLQLQTTPVDIAISGIGGEVNNHHLKMANLTLKSKVKKWEHKIPVYVLPKICDDLKYHDRVKSTSIQIDMLLSSHISLKLLICYNEEAEVLETHLGQCYLPEDKPDHLQNKSKFKTSMISNADLKTQLDKFWQCEMLGLQEKAENDEMQFEHQYAFKILQEKTYRQDGKYYMPLLFRPDSRPFKNNISLAKARQLSLERKLKRRPDIKKDYDTQMQLYIDKYASLVPEAEIDQEECCYLPHNFVLRDSTSTKMRIVHDAAAKGVDGFSINECLLPGPPLQPDIVGILLRFRLNLIGIVCDISKMFFQIGNLKEDKKWHRFLWRFNEQETLKHYNMDVTTFGFVDSPFKAIYAVRDNLMTSIGQLALTNNHRPMVEAAVDALINMYVDDYISGCETLEQAKQLFTNLNSIFDSAHFPLRKWLSNDENFMASIPTEMRGETKEKLSLTNTMLDSSEINLTKALGIEWDTKNDMIVYDTFSDLLVDDKVTKRTMLSTTARLYDPLGILSPFIVKGKILAQECWRLKLDWDTEVPTDLATEWRSWASQIRKLGDVKMPRCVRLQGKLLRQELHCFTDACEKALGAAVYLKLFYENGMIDSNLLIAKGKVANVKEISLPRKELNALVLGSQLIKTAAYELNIPIDQCYCHTDSLTTWQWIQKDPSNWKVYVKNRVTKITSSIAKEQIFHVPGNLNPADIVSRGCNIDKIDTFWLRGPAFMQTQQLHAVQNIIPDTTSCLEEQVKGKAIALLAIPETTEAFKPIWDVSNYRKFLRITAYTTRMLDKCLSRGSGQNPACGNISEQEMKSAEYLWIKQSQKESFPTEYNRLFHDLPIQQNSRLTTLVPVADNTTGLMRCKGRLAESGLTYDQIHPIILPKPKVTNLQSINNNFVARFIYDKHCTNQHAGANWIYAELRAQGYWLLGGAKQVRKVISRCIACQKAVKQPQTQAMGQLPNYRLESNVKPFSYTGVDAAGPIYLTNSLDDSQQIKAYIIVFTCLTSRAVHLELTLSQKAEDFMNCIRLLIARRGAVYEFLSDNYRTHKRMDLELSTLFEQAKSKYEAGGKSFKWRFIPDCAPWFGAAYERMIRTIKESLRKVIGKAHLTEKEMRPLLAEVESYINDRPLTSLDSSTDSIEPITPSMIITGHRLGSLPQATKRPDKFFDNEAKKEINITWRKRQSILNQMWNKWQKEYLLSLTRTQKWQKEKEDLKVGDIVLIVTDKLARGEWPLARVIKNMNVHNLRTRPTDKVRAVSLRLSNGKEVKRPVLSLVKLECD